MKVITKIKVILRVDEITITIDFFPEISKLNTFIFLFVIETFFINRSNSRPNVYT